LTAKYLHELRHQGAVAEIAKVKFPFPGPQGLDYETIVNVPKPKMAVGEEGGKDLYPDIVVVRRPGQWLLMMAEVETPDTVNDETAQNDWLPMSKVGDLYVYVPAGMIPETKQLLKKHGIRLKGIRTWRFRPVWGLDVAEA
jgi:hypothetical protein